MLRGRISKTEYVGFFMEPALRRAIEREAARREVKLSRLVRDVLREQIGEKPPRSRVLQS